jgi:hypothetical protein
MSAYPMSRLHVAIFLLFVGCFPKPALEPAKSQNEDTQINTQSTRPHDSRELIKT